MCLNNRKQVCGTYVMKCIVNCLMRSILLQGQNQSGGSSGPGGSDKKEDKDKKKKYEPPVPTSVGRRRKRTKGPDAATKLPQGTNYNLIFLILHVQLMN